MTTLAQIRAAVDVKLAQLWPTVQAKEDAYAAAHGGRYWQGLRTASVIPADGNTTLPDIGTTTPVGTSDPWPAALLSSPLPMALEITEYDGPSGYGYQATVSVVVLGVTYARTAQVGAESYRVSSWAVVS